MDSRAVDFEFYVTLDSDSIRPYMPADTLYLLPASSWARKGLKAPNLPPHARYTAADCGGFVATMRWGDYRYTPQEYVTWLETFNPVWAATMDYCCEPEVAGQAGLVRERQDRTTEMAWRFWRDFPASWIWVPTVQGWEPEDYQRHARELWPLVRQMQGYYGLDSAFRVGIGTLCRRASSEMIRDVVRIVADELPGVPLHLWGVKLSFLKAPTALHQQVASMDSAAWNGMFGSSREVYKAHSRAGMTQREYVYQIALPRYTAKLQRALGDPKQSSLFDANTGPQGGIKLWMERMGML